MADERQTTIDRKCLLDGVWDRHPGAGADLTLGELVLHVLIHPEPVQSLADSAAPASRDVR